MTNSTAKLSPGAVNRGNVLTACFRDIQVNSNGVCNYYDFIRREGLSLAIWFDIVESAFGENIHMTVKDFCKYNVHQLMFLVLKLVWIRIEYSLVEYSVESLMFQNLLEPASNNTTR